MDLHAWLDAERGRSLWIAEKLGLSRAAVSLWRYSGVPFEHMERVEELTGRVVRVDDMLRHAYRQKTEKAA